MAEIPTAAQLSRQAGRLCLCTRASLLATLMTAAARSSPRLQVQQAKQMATNRAVTRGQQWTARR